MPQSQSWQQFGFTDMQLLQQQAMLKQMQELQRKQQLQPFVGSMKNIDGAPFNHVINGTPVHNSSNMFTNWGQQGSFPSLQGLSLGARAQERRSSGEAIQQYDASAYGSPMATAGNNSVQQYLQGIPDEQGHVFTNSSGNTTQQPVAQSLGYTHSLFGGQNVESSNQAFVSRQDYSGSNLYSQFNQVLSKDNTLGSFEQANISQEDTLAFEPNANNQAGWLGHQQDNKSMRTSPSQGATALDPLEQKILFNMDDNVWDITSGNYSEIGDGNSGNALAYTDSSSTIPSVQCGSWSALMQAALAETSSSDTGVQEEWSGLTFQNTDLSADNQTSNFVESGHQQAECVENNLQSASGLSPTEYQYLNSSDFHSCFPGFQHAVTNNLSVHQERLLHDSQQFNQPFPQTGGRIGSNPQQSSPSLRKPEVQMMAQTNIGSTGPNYGSNASQPYMSSADQLSNNTDFWSAQQVRSETNSTSVQKDFGVSNSTSGPVSRASFASLQNQNRPLNQLAYTHPTNAADTMRDNVVNQYVSSNLPQALNVQGEPDENHQRKDSSNIFPTQYASGIHGQQGHSAQTSNIFNSQNSMEKGQSPVFQSNVNTTDPSTKGISGANMVNALGNSTIFQSTNMGGQRSQNNLQLSQNVNRSGVASNMAYSGLVSLGQRTMSTTNQPPSPVSSPLLAPLSQKLPTQNLIQASQNSWQKSVAPATASSIAHQTQSQSQPIPSSSVVSQPLQSSLHSAAARFGNASLSYQNSTGPTQANPVVQQYIGFGSPSVSQPSVAYNLSQWDGLSSKLVNEWTTVPVLRHPAGDRSDVIPGSDSSNKYAGGMIGALNLNEQETENMTPSRSSAKPVTKHDEDKSHQLILDSYEQPASKVPDSADSLGGSSERNRSFNQISILYATPGSKMADFTDQHIAITRPNKRKTPTSELIPWHKEMAHISVTLPNSRVEEWEWAQATNRLMEVGNEAVLQRIGQTIYRPKKRLLLTTCLMQSLLRPAPEAMLSRDAASGYDSLMYIVSRLSLGDACSMSSARDKNNRVDKNSKEESMSRVVKKFSSRIKLLEENLLSLDKKPSLVDIRVECQDLERFAVINRFAKFHSRTQPDSSNPLSSGPSKLLTHRYVTAVPMPKNLPEGLQCISL